jgi:hypothetical protein
MWQVDGFAGQPPVIEHQLILGDYVLNGPRPGEGNGTCHLRYDRLGAPGLAVCLLPWQSAGSLRPV